MKVRTVHAVVSAPRDTVFKFLADVENLPKWATEFCERVYLERGRWKALTSQGEMYCDITASDGTGVIDMRSGPTPEQMGLFPMRVIPTGVRSSMIMFTFVQPPEMPDEIYDRQYESLLSEMRGLVRRFGGGSVHAPHADMQLADQGLN